jgi:hypothetical protein
MHQVVLVLLIRQEAKADHLLQRPLLALGQVSSLLIRLLRHGKHCGLPGAKSGNFTVRDLVTIILYGQG